MARIRLTLEYDGTNYSGWQRQINAMSVQQRLEEALQSLTGERIVVTGSSRTDAGVHSLGQTVHFDTASRIPPEKYSFALNTRLPEDIRVRQSMAAAEDFHARFHTKGKTYRYQIYNHAHASAILRNTHAHVMYPMDMQKMQSELDALVGTHDFGGFAASGSIVKDTVRTIYSAFVERQDEVVSIYVTGTGFLYNMVRIIAGTASDVATGRIEPGAIRRAIETGNRLDLGMTAPACGLTLMRVYYDQAEIPEKYRGILSGGQ